MDAQISQGRSHTKVFVEAVSEEMLTFDRFYLNAQPIMGKDKFNVFLGKNNAPEEALWAELLVQVVVSCIL